MAVKPINNPIFEFTCDFCGSQDNAAWIPENWDVISINLGSGGMGNFHICQDCITDSAIVVLINKAKTNMAVPVEQ